jgi:hypothetical protein
MVGFGDCDFSDVPPRPSVVPRSFYRLRVSREWPRSRVVSSLTKACPNHDQKECKAYCQQRQP